MLAEWSRGVVERLRDDEAFSARVQSEFAKGVRDAMRYDHLGVADQLNEDDLQRIMLTTVYRATAGGD